MKRPRLTTRAEVVKKLKAQGRCLKCVHPTHPQSCPQCGCWPTNDTQVDALTSLPPYGGPLKSEVWEELRADLLGKPDRYEPVKEVGYPQCTDWCAAREVSLGLAWDTLIIAKKALEEILLECDLNRGRALIVDSVRQCAIAALQNIAADQGGKQ